MNAYLGASLLFSIAALMRWLTALTDFPMRLCATTTAKRLSDSALWIFSCCSLGAYGMTIRVAPMTLAFGQVDRQFPLPLFALI